MRPAALPSLLAGARLFERAADVGVAAYARLLPPAVVADGVIDVFSEAGFDDGFKFSVYVGAEFKLKVKERSGIERGNFCFRRALRSAAFRTGRTNSVNACNQGYGVAIFDTVDDAVHIFDECRRIAIPFECAGTQKMVRS